MQGQFGGNENVRDNIFLSSILDVTSLGKPFLISVFLLSTSIIFFIILCNNYKFILVCASPNIPFLGQENYFVYHSLSIYLLNDSCIHPF